MPLACIIATKRSFMAGFGKACVTKYSPYQNGFLQIPKEPSSQYFCPLVLHLKVNLYFFKSSLTLADTTVIPGPEPIRS